MFTDDEKKEMQEYYDEVGNIKKVATKFHTSYDTLRKFIVFKDRPNRIIKPYISTYNYRNEVKKKLVEYKGGKCQLCGYDKCIAALDFHHLDPEQKDFTISGGTKSFEHLKSEVDKCILVCANCHREIHANLNKEKAEECVKKIEEYRLKLYIDRDPNFLENNKIKPRTTICLECGKEFPYVKGKKFCSDECRYKHKNYPSYEEVLEKYNELKSQNKVAEYFNLTRKIIIGILKRKGDNYKED